MEKEKFYHELIKMFKENRGKTIGGVLGFLAGIMFLLIGFFKTLLIIVCTLLGYFLGSNWDIDGDIKKILNKILPPRLR